MTSKALSGHPSRIAAAIIAGGDSLRMGSPKALLTFQGETLIARTANILSPLFTRIVVVTASETIEAAARLPALPDIFPGKGPLGGIHAALSHFNSPVFCFACDMPYLNRDFIGYMRDIRAEFEIAVPQVNGFYEPLHAIYTPACLPHIEKELNQERTRSLQKIIGERHVLRIGEVEARRFDSTLQMFENWNTPLDIGGGRIAQ